MPNFIDEPTSGLDVMAREGILDALRAYMEQEERAILISSHISGDLENLCDDLYLIDQGKIRLHEDTDVLLDQYGILKVTESEFAALDKQYILAYCKEDFGYRCLTDQKQYYMENMPQIVIEKGTIDEVMKTMLKVAAGKEYRYERIVRKRYQNNKKSEKNDADLCWNGSFTASVRCGDFLYPALYGIRDDERCDQHDQL